jgi:hypothetical protein
VVNQWSASGLPRRPAPESFSLSLPRWSTIRKPTPHS